MIAAYLLGLSLVLFTSNVEAILIPQRVPVHSSAPKNLPLQDALKWLRQNRANDRICLALGHNAKGGLGNYLGYFNTVLNFGLEEHVRVIFPKIHPPGHKVTIGTSMENMFGEERSCSGAVTAYDLVCDISLPDRTNISYPWSNKHERCGVSQFVANLSHPVQRSSEACDCEHLLVMPAGKIRYSFDYGRTRQRLSNRYWRAESQVHAERQLPGNLQTCARNVVAHVRLGDVAHDECTIRPALFGDAVTRTSGLPIRSPVALAPTPARADRAADAHSKHICPQWYMVVLSVVLRALPENCACVTLVSDGDASHPDIEAILSNLTASGHPRPQVLGSETSADQAFKALTHSDVMVVGSSGFSRLAGVLARNTTAVVGPVAPSHPLDNLASVSQLTSLSGLDLRQETSKKLHQNQAFLSLVSACPAA
eukprot:TRINITY_DN39673_c0_g1_i1.p1 TRINITY_DN39673_c0_g1~~TRINITY_DN39673_c0_g1_i1.p1  ORF type:complete len:425 (-),score=23.87 TRINITY_DN39673_c0_g1_i1:71-1345(-)